MMLAVQSGTPEVRRTTPDGGARFTGIFLMALWGLAMVVYTGDMAASDACTTSSCAWTGLAAIHTAMQGILLLAAIGTGAAGAGIWFGSMRAVPTSAR
jgi:hypothetical protein